MANLITVARLLLLFVVVWLIYRDDATVLAWCMLLLAVVFVSDGLDGYVARRRGSTSTFGAVFDIAGDRIVENVLWVVFAHLDVIPLWVPLLVITRGSIVDALRSLSYAEGMTAFGERTMMRSAFTRWLTAGRFMRGLFGYAKAAGFVFLTGLYAQEIEEPAGGWLGDLYDVDAFEWFGWGLVWLAVALTIIRGLPVVYDAMDYVRARDEQASPTSTAAVPPPNAPGATRTPG